MKNININNLKLIQGQTKCISLSKEVWEKLAYQKLHHSFKNYNQLISKMIDLLIKNEKKGNI